MVLTGQNLIYDVGHYSTVDELRRLVYMNFGLGEGFAFDAMVFMGGFQDIFNLCSYRRERVDGTRGDWVRFERVAQTERGLIYTTEGFVQEREEYLEAMAKDFRCDILDAGLGFPKKKEAVKRRANFHGETGRNSWKGQSSWVALYGWSREYPVYKLERLYAESRGHVWGTRPSVFPFPMPYHEVSFFLVATEGHLGRMVMQNLNGITHHYLTHKWFSSLGSGVSKGIRLCPGTPA